MSTTITKQFSGDYWLESAGAYSVTLAIDFDIEDDANVDVRTFRVLSVDEYPPTSETQQAVIEAVLDHMHDDGWDNDIAEACRESSYDCERDWAGRWAVV